MKMELISTLALTLVLYAAALPADWNVDWLDCTGECHIWTPWQAYGIGDTLTFSGPTPIYTNCCYVIEAYQVTVDPGNKIVQLGPDTSIGFCPAIYAPTCGIAATVGPLPAGDWLFIADTITGSAMIPFHIDAPPPVPNLKLLAPKDQEQILRDSTYTVRWTDSPGKGTCGGSYLLSYSTDHGETWLPVDTNSIDGDCLYNWEIPLTPDGGPYSLLIQDADDPETFDSVEYFHVYDCNETIPGDLNADCYVDFRDYSMLVSSWPTTIDFSSILQLAEQWCGCRNSKDPACGY